MGEVVVLQFCRMCHSLSMSSATMQRHKHFVFSTNFINPNWFLFLLSLHEIAEAILECNLRVICSVQINALQFFQVLNIVLTPTADFMPCFKVAQSDGFQFLSNSQINMDYQVDCYDLLFQLEITLIFNGCNVLYCWVIEDGTFV